MRRWCVVAAVSPVLVWSSFAEARPFRVTDIPNGSKFTCLNCHDDLQGGTFNNFGSAARMYLEAGGPVQEAHVDWASLCPGDADGDGKTNGVELGDPDCIWQPGDADPSGSTSNPGHGDADAVCGNGKLDAGENCEGAQLTLTSCLDLQSGVGDLTCNANCTYDYSDCSLPPGGNVPAEYTGDDCSAAGSPGASTSGRAGRLGFALFVAAALAQSLRSRRRTTSSSAAI